LSNVEPSELERAWSELRAEAADANYFRARRLPALGIETYAALRNTDSALSVVFRLPAAIAPSARTRFHADGIGLVRVAAETDRHLLVAIVEETPQAGGLFSILAADIANNVAFGPAAGAGSRLVERLLQWQGALRARRDGLSRDAIIGLIGELTVLEALATSMPPLSAVNAWKGPEDGVQDFRAEGIAIEVKATAGSHALVPITSLDQLDARALRRLALAVVRLVEDPAGESLTTLVGRIRGIAGGGVLEGKLALGKWRDQDAERYEEIRFRRVGIDVYDVRDGFPYLTRANAPSGVAEAAYRLDARAIAPFVLGAGALTALAHEMNGTLDGR